MANTLYNLGLTDSKEFVDAIDYIISCQKVLVDNYDWDIGGFTYSPYDNYAEIFSSSIAMDLLVKTGDVDKIDTNSLFQFLRNRLQQYSYSDQYYNQIYEWVEIGHLIGHFTDRILVEGQMFNYGVPNEDLFRTISFKNLYGEDINADTISISLDGPSMDIFVFL